MTSSLFYFLYFAAIGIYVPYWSLFLQHQGLNPVQIGSLYSIPALARIFFPAVYGYIADRFQRRKQLLIIASWLQLIPLLLIPFAGTYWQLFLLLAVYGFFNAPLLPFAEATVREEQAKGTLDYGKARLWGTISFVFLALGFGKVLDRFTDAYILYGFLLFQVLLAAVAFFMPQAHTSGQFHRGEIRGIFSRRSTQLFLGCVFLMAFSHGTFYGFYSIHLANLGYARSSIGIQWAIAAAGEVIVFFYAARILRSFSHSVLFSICFLIAAVRWCLTFASSSFWVLCAAQSLHAFTFGVFHLTCIDLIHRNFPAGFRSVGQSLYSSAGGGLGHFAGVFVSGYLWNLFGGAAFLINGAIAFLTFLLSLYLRKHEQTKAVAVEDQQPSYQDREGTVSGM